MVKAMGFCQCNEGTVWHFCSSQLYCFLYTNGPVSDDNYETAPFPGIQNALALAQAERNEHDDDDDEAKNQQWAAVQHEIWHVVHVIKPAALLQGSLI
jgi:hypothetical protein